MKFLPICLIVLLSTLFLIFGWAENISPSMNHMNSKKFRYQQRFVKMEEHIPRESFALGERSLGSTVHEIVIAIQQKNLQKLRNEVYARATPGSPLYQKWLNFHEVGSMVQNKEGFESVKEWLDAYNVEIAWSSPYQEYIRAYAPISTWEEMLSTQFFAFEDKTRMDKQTGKGKIIHRALDYSIPAELKESISAVFYTVQVPPRFKPDSVHKILKTPKPKDVPPEILEDLPYKSYLRFKPKHVAAADVQTVKGPGRKEELLGQVGQDVDVAFLDSYYKVNSNLASRKLNQSVFETSTQYFSPSDLTEFQQKYDLTIQAAISYGGHSTSTCTSNTCGEGNLDIQYIMGMAQRTASIFWYVPSTGDPFITWITDVVADPYPPQANSMSWGEIETLMSSATVTTWENEAMKLASRGVTITVSSGDDGAANVYGSQDTCLCKGQKFDGVTSTGYNPSFPATSEWVTAVGATMGPETNSPEVVCASQTGGVITSGGGFSIYVTQPSYQSQALNYYFANNNPPSGYNTNGRGYPDVSLIGVNYQVIIQGLTYTVYGTSCSSPVIASFVTLVNSARYDANMSAIGFINPTLYSVGYNSTLGIPNTYNASFNDVTSGDNMCCASSNAATAVCCSTGFTAAKGWDPTTGWGSIDYTDFAAIFEVAAPYNPSNSTSDSSSSNPLGSLSALEIAVIVLVILGAVSGLFFCYTCVARKPEPSPLLSQQQQGVAMPAIAVAVPAQATVNPVYVQR